MFSTYIHTLTALLLWTHPNPVDVGRLQELASVAADVATTDASDVEAEELVAVAIHESNVHPRAVGDGGRARGAWQVHGRDASAREALSRLRWSERACHDLSLFAGCGGCGRCPDGLLASLLDPTAPRR